MLDIPGAIIMFFVALAILAWGILSNERDHRNDD